MFSKLMLKSILIAVNAGKEILKIYNDKNFNVKIKDDKSPLTTADTKSNQIIMQQLEDTDVVFTDGSKHQLHIICEEMKNVNYEERKNWEYLWHIDPLDGTKEFIKRNGEFTVNIALIHKNYPVLGTIYLPVLDKLYFANKDLGSFKLVRASEFLDSFNTEDKESEYEEEMLNQIIRNSIELPDSKYRHKSSNQNNCSVIASRSHSSKETDEYVDNLRKRFENIEYIGAGSSLKFCFIAEGKADIYPRFFGTWEWDTAAGQAIVESAGGSVICVDTRKRLVYNKKNLKNPFFIAKNFAFANI